VGPFLIVLLQVVGLIRIFDDAFDQFHEIRRDEGKGGRFTAFVHSRRNVFDTRRSSGGCFLLAPVGPNLHIARESQSHCKRGGLPSLVERHSVEQDGSFSLQTLAGKYANFDALCGKCGAGFA